uniref:Uncharacterized protein n=1 Tax=Anopheles dirus TaxID=7168 RepID=A0A182N6S3_9DIPT
MATRLATQRNFITVAPATGSATAAAPVTIEPGDECVTLQKTVEAVAAAADGSESPVSNDPVDSVEVDGVATTIMASRSSSAGPAQTTTTTTTLPTITVAGGLKNGSAKGSLMSTALLANNANIMNLLSGANGLSLQQIIHKKQIVINTNGTVIDIVPMNDESDSVELKVENEKLLEGGASTNESTESGSSPEATGEEAAQVTAQVAVVQSQSPTSGTPQYITVT